MDIATSSPTPFVDVGSSLVFSDIRFILSCIFLSIVFFIALYFIFKLVDYLLIMFRNFD